MAYVDQQKKKEIVAELKKVMPKNWKYTVSIKNYSTIVLSIMSADVDLINIAVNKINKNKIGNQKIRNPYYFQLNHYYLQNQFEGDLLEIFEKINSAINFKNYDNSDCQSDYVDVGHYVSINLGRWDKDFKITENKGN